MDAERCDLPEASGMRLKIAGACLLLALSTSGAARATSGTHSIRGSWIGAIPCLFTHVKPVPGHLTTVEITCNTSTIWLGGWTGVTHAIAKGTFNLVTGDSTGTISETFYGMATADRSVGTLKFSEVYRLDGATSTIHIVATMVAATGDFAGATGRVVFDGVELLGLQGQGGYAGTWTRP